MTKVQRNLTAILVVALWIALLLFLSGCNKYHIQRCDGSVCSTADISSMRKFKNINFRYVRETGEFELSAGDVGTDTSAISTLANVIMLQQQAQDNE